MNNGCCSLYQGGIIHLRRLLFVTFFVCLLVNYKVFSQERNLTLETVFLTENYF